MNNDLISREDLNKTIDGITWYHINPHGELVEGAFDDDDALYKAKDIYNAIDNAPTIKTYRYFERRCGMSKERPFEDIIPIEALEKSQRPQGEWTDLSTDGRHTGWIACSVCGQEPPNESNLRTNFCPNCGAKMKGGAV